MDCKRIWTEEEILNELHEPLLLSSDDEDKEDVLEPIKDDSDLDPDYSGGSESEEVDESEVEELFQGNVRIAEEIGKASKPKKR